VVMTKLMSYIQMKKQGFDINQSDYVYMIIRKYAPITDNEISRLTSMLHTSVVRSRNSLMKKGKIECVGIVTDSKTNRKNEIWSCV